MEYHPTQDGADDKTGGGTPDSMCPWDRTKRSTHFFGQHMLRAAGLLKQLDDEDISYLAKILDKIYAYYLHLNTTANCHKQFGIMTWVLGWGVFSNSWNIRHIKKNLRLLQEKNWQQDKQIKELAKYLNLTMSQVSCH